MGHKLAVDELGLPEPTLPLADLSAIRQADALRLAWPRADAIIGNPPYDGSQQLRRELGDDCVEWLRAEFGVGVKDLRVYWFRKAHDHLGSGGRAGLVGTNSISQNRGRGASLDDIVRGGGVITDAVSKQRWWRFGEVAVGMRSAIGGPSRYIAGNRVGKRILFAWQEPRTCPSDATNVFAFEDACAMGVLTSRVHGEWARMLSTLRGHPVHADHVVRDLPLAPAGRGPAGGDRTAGRRADRMAPGGLRGRGHRADDPRQPGRGGRVAGRPPTSGGVERPAAGAGPRDRRGAPALRAVRAPDPA